MKKLKLSIEIETAFHRKEGKDSYNLGALWFLCANKELKMADYMKLAGEKGFQLI